MTATENDLAGALARSRQQLAHDAQPVATASWAALTEPARNLAVAGARAYLPAAARAGIVMAAVVPGEIPAPARVTANARDVDGNPIDRDDYTMYLRTKAIRLPREDRLPLLAPGEADAVASLLDELAGIYVEEELGRLARELAVRIWDRMGD